MSVANSEMTTSHLSKFPPSHTHPGSTRTFPSLQASLTKFATFSRRRSLLVYMSPLMPLIDLGGFASKRRMALSELYMTYSPSMPSQFAMTLSLDSLINSLKEWQDDLATPCLIFLWAMTTVSSTYLPMTSQRFRHPLEHTGALSSLKVPPMQSLFFMAMSLFFLSQKSRMLPSPFSMTLLSVALLLAMRPWRGDMKPFPKMPTFDASYGNTSMTFIELCTASVMPAPLSQLQNSSYQHLKSSF